MPVIHDLKTGTRVLSLGIVVWSTCMSTTVRRHVRQMQDE